MKYKDLPPITKNCRLWCNNKSKLPSYIKEKFKGKIWEDSKCPENIVYVIDPNYSVVTDENGKEVRWVE